MKLDRKTQVWFWWQEYKHSVNIAIIFVALIAFGGLYLYFSQSELDETLHTDNGKIISRITQQHQTGNRDLGWNVKVGKNTYRIPPNKL